MIAQLLVSVIVVLVITAGVFIFWIYRSILHPLNMLKDAAQNIKEGNLDLRSRQMKTMNWANFA